MDLIIRALQLIGYWSHPNRSFNSIQAITLIAVVLIWVIIPELAFIMRHEPNFGIIVRNLVEMLIIGMVVPQGSIALCFRPLLEETYREVGSILDKVSTDPHRDVQLVIKQLKMFSEWIFKGYIGAEVLVALPYFLSIPVTTIVKYCTTGVWPTLRGVFETDYLLFDPEANIWLWLMTVIANIAVMSYVILFLVSSHCLFWSLLRNVSGLFKIISMKIGRLDEIVEDVQRHEELIEIVGLHEAAYRGARALEKSLNIFMLILYGMCILNICLTMVALSLPNSDRDLLHKMTVVMVYILFHILVYSLLGTELMCASIATSEAFYKSQWYMRAVQEQRTILFALARSQRMAALTTGKFFYVSRTTFGMALRSAMSYFAVLRQVYGAQ
nr:odorant receptor 85b-like [Aedes albopictus]